MFDWVTFENPVAVWWLGISAAGIVNICIWFWLRFARFQHVSISSVLSFRKNQDSIIWLSFFYVFVCAFRSFLPRADVQRICLFDTFFSSVFVGRTVATVAELAFIAQWSIVLGLLAKKYEDRAIKFVSVAILFSILIAEIFSWYAVITTNYLGNSVEESLWGLSYAAITFALIKIWLRVRGPMRLATGFAIAGSVLYVAFMFAVDVPMYLGRLREDMASGKTYLGFAEGIHDLLTRWHITYAIADWKTEIPWMSLYFTFAVLVSLALCLVALQLKPKT